MAASPPFKLDDYKKRMDGAIAALQHEFSGLRTGRASPSLLDPIKVDAYGAESPLTSVASVSVPEPRMISVNIWDKSLVGAVDKAIRAANLGLNPIVDGQTLRIPIPPLTGERRTELAKVAGKYAEQQAPEDPRARLRMGSVRGSPVRLRTTRRPGSRRPCTGRPRSRSTRSSTRSRPIRRSSP